MIPLYDEQGARIASSQAAGAALLGCSVRALAAHTVDHADGRRLVSRPSPDRVAAGRRVYGSAGPRPPRPRERPAACAAPGCGRPPTVGDLCMCHYQRRRRAALKARDHQ